jgi:hypothetical protein
MNSPLLEALRIDHLLLSPSLAGRLVAAGVERDHETGFVGMFGAVPGPLLDKLGARLALDAGPVDRTPERIHENSHRPSSRQRQTGFYLDTPGRCAIEDSGWRRRVVIEKVGAASSVVWNPWAEKAAAMVDLGDPAWRSMVCVETGNIADNEVRLAADDEHQISTAISVDAGP